MATTPQRLNDRHEAAARLFVTGMRRAEVARRLGYYPTTLSALRRAPAFGARLRELRRQMEAAVTAEVAERIASIRPSRNREGSA